MNTKRISAKEFIDLKKTNNVTVLDLRTPIEAASECIDGCIALPLQDLNDERFSQILKEANSYGGTVHLLCQSGRRAELAVEKLQGHTDNQLVILDGGLNAIKAAGGEVTKGERNVMSLERQVRITAGLLVLSGVILGFSVTPTFFLLSGFVGAGLAFAGITDTCAMGMLLASMPWNKVKRATS